MEKFLKALLIFLCVIGLLMCLPSQSFAKDKQTHKVTVTWLLDPHGDCPSSPPFTGTKVIGSTSFRAEQGEEIDMSNYMYNPAGASYWQQGIINYNGTPCLIEFTYGEGGKGINPQTGEPIDGLPFGFDPFGNLTMPGTDVDLYYIYMPYLNYQDPPTQDGLDKIVIYVNRPNSDINSAKQTYKAYEIFHVGKADSVEEDVTNDYTVGKEVMPEDSGFSYWISEDDPWFDVVSESPYFNVVEISGSNRYNIYLKEDYPRIEATAIEMAHYFEEHIPEGVQPKIVTADTPSYDNDPGYYLIVSEINSNLILGTTNIAITEKAEYPTIDKDVDDVDVEIGQTVTYTIEVKFPRGSKAESIITDIMSEGLTYVNGSIEADLEGYSFNFDSENNKWTIIYPKSVIKEAFKDSEGTITIAYQCLINEKAVIDDGINPNTVRLDFSNYSTKSTAEINVTNVTLLKYDSADENKVPLAGANFSLIDKDKNVIPLVEVIEEQEYRIAMTDELNTVDSFTTGNSEILITGLAEDETYYFKENEPPAGYNALESNTLIDSQKIEISNSSGTVLPSTGGIGTFIFYLTGLLLLSMTVAALLFKKIVKE